MIGAMTGGTPRAEAINAALAVAQAEKIAFAVGSQRAALELGHSAKICLPCSKHPIIGNLGAVQLAQEMELRWRKLQLKTLRPTPSPFI